MIGMVLLIGLSLRGDDVAEGRKAYESGLANRADREAARPEFRDAATAFERSWQSGARQPAIARNAAQARLLAGDLGFAIRNYLMGLRASPADDRLLTGLADSRERVDYPLVGDLRAMATPPPRKGAWHDVGLTLDQSRLIAVTVAAVGWALLAWAFLSVRRFPAMAGVIALALAAAIGIGMAMEARRLGVIAAVPTAVVLEPCDFRTGNSDEYPKRIDPQLPAGVELRLIGERGGWRHVELADGTPGWVPADRVAVVD